MRKKLLIIFLFLVIPFFVSAYTKEDIINLVSNQELCDQETEVLYTKYFKTYSRLLESKEISEELANQIYFKLTEALNLIKKNNICSIEDLEEIPSNVKTELYNNLYNTSKLIIKAPNIPNNETNVKYNDDDTIDIYENGAYIDKISLKNIKFNYVGFNQYFVYFKYVLPSLLLILLVSIILTKKKLIFNNILIILFSLCLIFTIFYFTIGDISYDFYNLIKTMNYKDSSKEVALEVKNKKIVKYPTYGSKYGNLIIEALDINLPIYYGDSKEVLKKGIGQFGTFPGFNIRTILSGHNSKIFLNNLKNIKIDDIITIKTNYGIFEYAVSKIEILNEDQFSLLEKNDKKMLIIYTCYPFDEIVYSDQRFIVYANQIKEKWNDD